MKFKTTQEELLKALNKVIRVTTNKVQMFENIEIVALTFDTVCLKATNGETSIMVKFRTADAEGHCLINASKFYNVVSKLSGAIEFNDGEIKTKTTNIKIQLTEYFELPIVIESGLTKQVDCKQFKELLKNRLAIADSTTGIISGICLSKDMIASTNGNALSVAVLDNELPFNEIVITKQLAEEITKSFDDDKINIQISERTIMLEDENTKLISFVLAGNYPKFRQLIPKSFSHKAIINKKEMLSALDIISTVIDTKSMACKLSFMDDKIYITTPKGDGKTSIGVSQNDTEMIIGFNLQLLQTCLKNINNDMITFYFEEPLRACMLGTTQEQVLIMPMQLRN